MSTLFIRVYEMSAPVAVSSLAELRPVRHPALGVVDSHLGDTVGASRQNDSLLPLDTASPPDDEIILVCIYQTHCTML